jgi:hypothetical protein
MFDMKNLTRLKRLDENAPETMKAIWLLIKRRSEPVPSKQVR